MGLVQCRSLLFWSHQEVDPSQFHAHQHDDGADDVIPPHFIQPYLLVISTYFGVF